MISTLNSKFKFTRGLTLVELMVALAVFSILMLGLGTVFQTNRRNYATQESFARLQENARFALSMIAQDIRQAGFNGCNPKVNSSLDDSDPNKYSPALFDFSASIGGYESLGTGLNTTTPLNNFDPASAAPADWVDSDAKNLPNSLNNQVVPNSDVLVVKGGLALPAMRPVADIAVDDTQVSFGAPTDIKAGTIVFLSDCEGADVFQNTSDEAQVNLARDAGAGLPGNVDPTTKPLSHAYNKDEVEIIVATSFGYFVGRNAATGQPGLFRIQFESGAGGGSPPQEIAEGVENMQVLYGEDLNNDQAPDQYVTADAVNVPGNVVSVRVSLLVRSVEPLPNRPPDPNTYVLLGSKATGTHTEVDPQEGGNDDSRLRQVFGSTVFIRNAAVTKPAELPGT